MRFHPVIAAAVLLGVCGQAAQSATLTVDEALALSQKSGRPILAVAGQET